MVQGEWFMAAGTLKHSRPPIKCVHTTLMAIRQEVYCFIKRTIFDIT